MLVVVDPHSIDGLRTLEQVRLWDSYGRCESNGGRLLWAWRGGGGKGALIVLVVIYCACNKRF